MKELGVRTFMRPWVPSKQNKTRMPGIMLGAIIAIVMRPGMITMVIVVTVVMMGTRIVSMTVVVVGMEPFSTVDVVVIIAMEFVVFLSYSKIVTIAAPQIWEKEVEIIFTGTKTYYR